MNCIRLSRRSKTEDEEAALGTVGAEEVARPDRSDLAEVEGWKIITRSRTRRAAFGGPTSEMVQEMGGREAFLAVFAAFYSRLHEDPLMNVLFNERPEERSNKDHGDLLGSFVLGFITGDRGYRSLLRAGKGHGLGLGHERAKSCPLRPVEHRGAGFTVRQSRAWIGHLSFACQARGTTEEFRKRLTTFLAKQLFRYGPFLDDTAESAVDESAAASDSDSSSDY